MSKLVVARVLLASVLAILATITSPGRVSAAGPRTKAAPLRVASPSPLAIVEGAPPSATHARGTAIVAWIHPGADGAELVVAEWDTARDAVVRRRTAARLDGTSFAVALSRAGGKLYALVSGPGADRAPTTLLALDDAFAVTTKRDFAAGGTPSLDGNERFLVVTTFESRAPTSPPSPNASRLPPDEVLVARVVDRATWSIVGARVFRGPQMLRSATRQLEGGSSVRVVGERAFFALPDREPVVVAASLPALSTIARRETPRGLLGAPTVARLTRLGDGVLAATAGRAYALGPSLEPRGVVDADVTSAAYEARAGKLLTDVPCGKTLGGASTVTPLPGDTARRSVVAWVFGRAIALAADDQDLWRAIAR